LKTKEVTILSAANYARFERIFAQIGAQMEQKTGQFAQNEPRLEGRKERQTVG
jgi:hypothetical protein